MLQARPISNVQKLVRLELSHRPHVSVDDNVLDFSGGIPSKELGDCLGCALT
jgi:hypothetical protein